MISIWLKNINVLPFIHIIAFIRATLTDCFFFLSKSSENKLKKLPLTSYTLQLHRLRSAYGADWIWGMALEPSDQIPSPADWRWKYSKDNRFAVDWWGAYDVNLNEYIFTCTCKGRCSWFKCVKKEVLCLPFCSCSVLQQIKILLDSLCKCRGVFKAPSSI